MSASAEQLPRKHRLSVEDYHRMSEAGILHEDLRAELIEGEIIDMVPIGSVHAGMVNHLGNLIKLAVGETALISTQNPVVAEPDSEPQPDVVLLRPREDYYKSALPVPADVLLVIEVADTSVQYDRDVKIPLYARHGLPEVWLVDVPGHKLVVHHTLLEGRYKHVEVAADLCALTIQALPHVELDLTGLFQESAAAC